jgi:hypothetical protein
LSRPTSQSQIEAGPTPVLNRRRIRRRHRRRGWVAVAVTIAILLTIAGGFLVYANTLPTSVGLNIKNGTKEVPTYTRLLLSFSRPVDMNQLASAMTIDPGVSGSLTATSGQTDFEFVHPQPLADLTTYTITLLPITDLTRHKVGGVQWIFTTGIIPHITGVTGPDGVALSSGAEILPGTPLTVSFNDTMDASSVLITIRAKPATLKWAADSRSTVVLTAGLASGPLTLSVAAGARDQGGRPLPGAFSFNTGLYYRYTGHTTALRYPALIQIPNDELAWDQNGLQAADIIFEYLAEGGIDRCTAIFQRVPDLIGPMRSSRFISLKIARHYRGLLFQSGESQATRARAASDPTPQFFDTIGVTFRTSARYAPDNLMIRAGGVVAAEARFSGIPAYAVPKARPNLSGGAAWPKLAVAEHYSTYAYDPVQGTYGKTELGHRLKDATLNKPLQIEMVVVIHTAEWLMDVGDGHGAHIHDFEMDTGGRAEFYYKGLRYLGAWKSINRKLPLQFSVGGKAITLPPGLVWVDVTAA